MPASIPGRPVAHWKFATPALGQHIIDRRRLFALLDHAGQITFVVAPAGYGKTTLFAAYLAQSGRRHAWYRIDRADNDLKTFLSGLHAAIRHVIPDRGPGDGQAIGSETSVEALLNYLADRPLPQTVVLDDFHHIEDPSVLQAVQQLADHLPPNAQLIIVSRTTPGLRAARWRLSRRLTEVGPDDLRFEADEGRRLLEITFGDRVPGVSAASVVDRAEGWAAGIQLAAIALRCGASPDSVLSRGGQADSLAFDYLAEEVMQTLSPALRRFLMAIAVLDEITLSGCLAVTGDPTSAEHLESVIRDRLFVVPLDSERLRFHDLFRDFLRRQLQRETPEFIKERYARASQWAERSIGPSAAIDLALAGSLADRAASLIAQVGDQLWTPAEMMSLVRWTSAIPADALARHPLALLFRAWALLLTNQLQPAAKTLDQAHVAIQSLADPGELIGIWYAIRASVTARVDPTGAVGLYRTASLALPPTTLNWLSAVWLGLGHCLIQLDRPAEACRPLRTAVEVGRASGNRFGASYAAYYLGLTELHRQRHDEARSAFVEAAELAGDGPISLWGWLGEAEVALACADFGPATDRALESVRLGKLRHDHEAVGSASLILARITAATGDSIQAEQLLNQAERAARSAPVSLLLHRVHAWRAQISQRRDERPFAANRTQSAETSRVGQALIEPLTEVEIALLRLLSQGMTNDQIAAERHIGVNTVKWHLKNIYGKLGVGNRTGAVTAARSLELL